MTEGRFVPATCDGGSMEPSIPRGKKILVDTEWGDLWPGDVVCFEDANGAWTVHRVIGRFLSSGRRFYVQAQDDARMPGIVPEDRVIGRVRGLDEDYERDVTVAERLLALDAIFFHYARKVASCIPGVRRVDAGALDLRFEIYRGLRKLLARG